jgi:pimeloyl-ACP methyl ester carboxylesterase
VAAKVIKANGLRHHVIDEGNGEPVLLLHGFPDSSLIWRHQIPALTRAGYRVIVPDLRGFGQTEAPAEVEDYRMEKILADVAAILDHLGLNATHLICHDWGAIVGWTFAALQPQRVNRFAALCVGHPNAFFAADIEQFERFWYILLFQFRGFAEEVLERDDWALFRAWLRNHPDGDQFIADLSRPGRLTAALDWYRANLSPKTLFGRPSPLPNVKAPTLGVWSTGDDYLVEAPLLNSGAYVDGSWRYERIEASSHFVQVDQPEQVNRLLLDHLAARA